MITTSDEALISHIFTSRISVRVSTYLYQDASKCARDGIPIHLMRLRSHQQSRTAGSSQRSVG